MELAATPRALAPTKPGKARCDKREYFKGEPPKRLSFELFEWLPAVRADLFSVAEAAQVLAAFRAAPEAAP